MRKLASVQLVDKIELIEGADFLELAVVNGWKTVVKKGEFKPFQKIIYFEIDSFLPIRDEFEFLRKSSLRQLNGVEGFRIKTVKLRGQISQGLILSLNDFELDQSKYEVDEDLTEFLNITKYEKPFDTSNQSKGIDFFPSFIKKTDEERVQNLFKKLNPGDIYDVFEKLEGTSATYFLDSEKGLRLCSRNQELDPSIYSVWSKVADKYTLETALKDLFELSGGANFAIQGEIIGPGVQGNYYGLSELEFYVHNLWDIDCGFRVSGTYPKRLISIVGLSWCPILPSIRITDLESLLLAADGFSWINPKKLREGIVLRKHQVAPDSVYSFKVISNKYLLKES